MTGVRGRSAAIAAALAAIALPATAGAAPATAKDGKGPRATIRWTAHGIPHILAHSWKGLGFGYGYAFASQNICTIADSYVTVDAERSRFFGPDKSWTFRGNGFRFNNLDSDFFFQKVIDEGAVEGLLKLAPPRGPKPQVKRIARGYAAGYDRYLRRVGVENLPDPRCRGKDWVRPITVKDVYRRFYALGLLASQGVAIDGIAAAAPPTPRQDSAARQAPVPDAATLQELGERLRPDIGSNAYGLGSAATSTGRGMVLGNPHFPWEGSERFFQAQLTIPGKIDVSGASLFGVPLINIGHTRHLAWSHTVSTAYRFTPYQETLVPGSPTTYLVDGQPREMEHRRVTVKVRDGDGSLSNRSHTFYSTIHGPVLTSLVGLPAFPWTPLQATTMRDANADNFRYLNHFFDVNRAQSTPQLYDILRRDQGVPWVNTIASDSKGRAFYADISVVPNVTNAKAQSCNTAAGVATYAALRLPVLDGSRSDCDWGTDADAVIPGIFGPNHLPHLFRDDFVTNSNDSYWLSNPSQPLEGFSRIIGDERTQRSLRTRLGLIMVQQRLAGTDGRPGRRFTLRQIQDTVFNNRQYAGELFRDQLVALCESNPTLMGSSGPVNVSAACPVLRAWDLHDNLDSTGAVLFRRFATRVLASTVPTQPPSGVFTTPFDASDPVNTPNGLDTSNPNVQRAFADAVNDLRSADIPLAAPLRGYQFEQRGDDKIPIHGGPGTVGVFNAINVPWVAGKGYPDIPHGSSFVMAASLRKGRCPKVRTILTYSQSENPASRYNSDQTRMFSQKKWVRDRFCPRQIRRDPKLRVQHLGG
jgi:acyl-homoserine-lactone acylase